MPSSFTPDHRHSRDAVTSRLRLRHHDYSSACTYCVTICTEKRICLFGEITDGTMMPSAAGVVIDSWWHSIPRRFPDVMLDMMVVMPNHLHGIISLGVRPEGEHSTPHLSTVMHWFKDRTTGDYSLGVQMEGWQRFPGKLWQSGYYDQIMESERALERMQTYIEANPSQWAQDIENPMRKT